jgi:hypothetical protein
VALRDGRPTLVEFYADWCEACRAMAPAMAAVEQEHHGALDVVLLNVDNPRWQPELERYEVNGIPQLELFNAAGTAVGRSLAPAASPSWRPSPAPCWPKRPCPSWLEWARSAAWRLERPALRQPRRPWPVPAATARPGSPRFPLFLVP